MNFDRYVDVSHATIGQTPVRLEHCVRLGERCERATHASGLTVLLVPKQMTLTYAQLVVGFGARDNTFSVDGRTYRVPDGVAHFLEHKMFANPDGTDANELFSALGADANAWTDYDRTAYLFSTAESPVPALRVLLDMVMTPYFTKENVAKEKGIIREEILMGEDDPWQMLYEQAMRATYSHHALRRRICGTLSSIARITPATLERCYRAFYRPSNMCLVMCGNVTMAEVLAVVDAALPPSGEEQTKVLRCPDREEAPTVVRCRSCRRARVAQPLFQITLKDTCLPQDGRERLYRESAMNLLSEVLFSRAAPFYGELFEKGLITPGYSYGYSTAQGAAYHAVTGEARDARAVWKKYKQVVAAAQREGLSTEDVERCRRVLYASFVSQFDYPEDIADLTCEAYAGGTGVFDTLEVLQRITKEELETLLREMFLPEATTLCVLRPDRITKDNKEE